MPFPHPPNELLQALGFPVESHWVEWEAEGPCSDEGCYGDKYSRYYATLPGTLAYETVTGDGLLTIVSTRLEEASDDWERIGYRLIEVGRIPCLVKENYNGYHGFYRLVKETL